ncbi:MAG: helix-turn-helix domain-containing protein [Candidatus Altiarchaeota archaeon]
MSKELLARSIASEIVLSKNPGNVMRKWREILGIKQNQIAAHLGISASVISDYEANRRSPGVVFVKKFIDALISLENKNRVEMSFFEKFFSGKEHAILSIREFLVPMKISKFVKIVKGKVLSNNKLIEKKIYGYTAIDSIRAILELNEDEFSKIYGLNTERALIFTKVKTGRSPMIAIKVTPLKPSVVILHGLSWREVDKLAIKISEVEKIPLVVSTEKDEESLIKNINMIEN